MNQNGLLYEIHTTEMNVLHIFAAISEKKAQGRLCQHK